MRRRIDQTGIQKLFELHLSVRQVIKRDIAPEGVRRPGTQEPCYEDPYSMADERDHDRDHQQCAQQRTKPLQVHNVPAESLATSGIIADRQTSCQRP